MTMPVAHIGDWEKRLARQDAFWNCELHAEPDELDTLIESLRPEGIWMWISGIADEVAAEAVIRRVTEWR